MVLHSSFYGKSKTRINDRKRSEEARERRTRATIVYCDKREKWSGRRVS